MGESQFNKFKEDKLRVLLAQETKEGKDIWQNSALSQRGQEVLHGLKRNCDDISSAKAVLMANLLSYDSDVLSKESQDAGIQDTNSSTPNDLLVLSLVEQITDHVANLDKESQTNKMVNESLTAELERNKERVRLFLKQTLIVDLNKHEKLIDSQMDDFIRNRNAKFAAFQQELDTLKENLSNQVKEKESLSTTLTVFETECKEKESKYMDNEIVLENQNKELENTLFQRIKPTLYDGSFIAKEHDVISVINDDEALILDKKRHLKNELRKLKGKNVVDTAVSKPSATIAPGMVNRIQGSLSLMGGRNTTDAYISSTSQTNQETPSLVISLNVEEANDIEVAHMDNNPYVYFPTPEPSFEESSSQVIILDNVHSINQPPKHINKWNKDHPIDNVIGDPSRPVFTQNQLQDEALFYYFDAFLSSVEPMSYKEALTESSWIQVMQDK
ncbi:hypothetical protein Tco_0188670 [Tanacetum coccineum]